MPKRAAVPRLKIYEVVNYDRRESLIALVADALGPLVTRLKNAPPPPIRHWGPAALYSIEQLAGPNSAADAEVKLKIILGKPRCADWKVVVWRG